MQTEVPAEEVSIERVRSPLQLQGWNRFVKEKWILDSHRCSTGSETEIDGQWWVDRRGRISQPPTIPFTPIYRASPSSPRADHAWIEQATSIATNMCCAGTSGSIAFPPELLDVRPWQWQGFLATVAYTSRVSLPHDLSLATHSIRKQVGKAERAGYIAETARSLDDVIQCLKGTEQRQAFDYGITCEDLRIATSYLAPEHLRAYVCYSPVGEPASARVILAAPGTWAIDWVAGTSCNHRNSGATQLLIWHVLQDLSSAAAVGFDFGGANLPSIARPKMDWGGELVPFYRVRPNDVGSLFKMIIHRILSRRNK